MAVNFFHCLSSSYLSFCPPLLQSPRLSSRSKTRPRFSASTSPPSEERREKMRSTFMEFPYLSDPHRNLMVDLSSTAETRLGSHLLPCTLPENVRYFENQSGTSHATLHLRSGLNSSPIDFLSGAWIHSKLPNGGELNITSLAMYLNSSTDAPNFTMDLILSSPTSLILYLNLLPRKDLVLYPDYLKTFYQDTNLEDQRRRFFDEIPESRPYFSPSLYVRSLLSPPSIMALIKAEATERMEEIIREHVHPIAKEVLRVWLEQCAFVKREVSETERDCLQKRDEIVKVNSIEVDLASSFPRMFGDETANRVLAAIRAAYLST